MTGVERYCHDKRASSKIFLDINRKQKAHWHRTLQTIKKEGGMQMTSYLNNSTRRWMQIKSLNLRLVLD